MSKVMLVEDDDSLREIYSIRLTAEGYNIVSAHDGEEALAIAVRERPDLIVSDVMMPKITGFDMLDILRSTPETQNIKVIMMTALSSEEERIRGENLGADRYLVKSQVGIEDVVNAVHDVLGDRSQDGTISATAPQQPTVAPVVTSAPSGVVSPSVPVAPVAQAAQTPTAVPAAPSVPPVSAAAVANTIPSAAPVAAPVPVASTTPVVVSAAPAAPPAAPTVAPVAPTATAAPAPVSPVIPAAPAAVQPSQAPQPAPTVPPAIPPVA